MSFHSPSPARFQHCGVPTVLLPHAEIQPQPTPASCKVYWTLFFFYSRFFVPRQNRHLLPPYPTSSVPNPADNRPWKNRFWGFQNKFSLAICQSVGTVTMAPNFTTAEEYDSTLRMCIWAIVETNVINVTDLTRNRRSVEKIRNSIDAYRLLCIGLASTANVSCGSSLLDTTVAERLSCSPPTKVIRAQSSAGSLRIFACSNRARRCRWMAGFLGVLRFPPPSHSVATLYSPQSPTSALKTLMLRAVCCSVGRHSPTARLLKTLHNAHRRGTGKGREVK
ncbi:hypothetical protein PR048_015211 [Dryococelus australis]|uniref:Uncharacterized protein n=1 Tax=Dryococelus australis TaxID=614101 RepID=A0ABQ9HGB5_9NEOP|nr:hypothetical protein PR048_015211 [Dryococelus australis]